MKAIITKYLGPTNFKGSRIKVTAEGMKSKTYPWDSALNSEENHEAAAWRYSVFNGWLAKPGFADAERNPFGELVGGSYKNGYVFVFKGRK